MDELDAAVTERDRLLSEMAAVDFWDDEEGRVRVIERFRTLDVSTRIAQRFARPITALREAVDERTEPSAMLLESAARSLREWEEREHLEGVRALWLLLSVVDRELPPGDWLRDLARILMTWCRRVELRCTPVAFSLRGGDVLTRLALEVEGPGRKTTWSRSKACTASGAPAWRTPACAWTSFHRVRTGWESMSRTGR